MLQATNALKSTRAPVARIDVEGNGAASTGPLAQGREFVWTNADFARVQSLI